MSSDLPKSSDSGLSDGDSLENPGDEADQHVPSQPTALSASAATLPAKPVALPAASSNLHGPYASMMAPMEETGEGELSDDALTKVAAKLEDKMTRLEDEVAKQEDKMTARLEDEVAKQEDKMAAMLKDEVAKLEDKMAEMVVAKTEEMVAGTKDLKEQVTLLENKVKRLEFQVKEAADREAQYKVVIEKLNVRISKLEKEKSTIKENKEAEIRHLKEELNSKEKERETQAKEYERLIAEMKREIKHLEEKNLELQQQQQQQNTHLPRRRMTDPQVLRSTGGSETERQPLIRGLLQLDGFKWSGKGVHLAIIDYGFNKGALANGRKYKKNRFTFVDDQTVEIGNDENFLKVAEKIGKGRRHGTIAAVIAAGHEFCGYEKEESAVYNLCIAGVAYETVVQCHSLEKKNIGQALAEIQKFNNECSEKIDVVSISQISDRSDFLVKILTEIRVEQHTLIFAGSGNDPQIPPRFPANHKDVISVGSLQKNGRDVSKFSCTKSPYADVYTYGEVLAIDGEECKSFGKQQEPPPFKLENREGTSFATPAVAGLACLAIQWGKQEYKHIDRKNRNQLIFQFFKHVDHEPKKVTSASDFIKSLKPFFDKYQPPVRNCLL